MNERVNVVDIASNTVRSPILSFEKSALRWKYLTVKRLHLLQHHQTGHRRVTIGIHLTTRAYLDISGAPLGYSHHLRVASLFRPRRTSKCSPLELLYQLSKSSFSEIRTEIEMDPRHLKYYDCNQSKLQNPSSGQLRLSADHALDRDLCSHLT